MMFARKILALILLLFCTIAVIIFFIYQSSSPLNIVDAQLQALKQGELIKAYSYTSVDFQQMTPFAAFERYVAAYPVLEHAERSQVTTQVDHNSAMVKMLLRGDSGAITPVEFDLIKEKGNWRIFKIDISTAGTAYPSDKNVPAIKTYQNRESRYSIQYPGNWEADSTEQGLVVFNGPKDTPSFYSTINIQTILTKKNGGEYASIGDFIKDIKKQARLQSKETKFLNQTPYLLPRGTLEPLKGESFEFIYTYQHVTFKQWQIVLLRPDNQVFYAWAYTSPLDQYDNDLNIAKAMLSSWTIY
jgi:hypothetical protein